ncbi:phytolongin Phyl2.2 [Gastrolobium bilobum]|uniref:phytolongin Phyl2.2 n=1 Tax=Gastrolobium bilobum TaxID=150636 RepID=UPI002AB01BCC|nr:phytolongin Phyl2.2 [Gastrolobium bilobum]
MISNPELIHYACIARSNTILGHHNNNSKDPNIEALASKCISLTPPNHSLYTHTVKNRTYTFLIDPPFVYFAIFDHQLLKSQTLSFLNRIRSSFRETLAGSDHFASLCFQTQFDSIFRDALYLDSVDGKRSATLPMKPAEGLTKKKRLHEPNGMIDAKDAATVDLCDDVVSLPVSKGTVNDRQKAKHVWKKHVWVVLLLDLFVCAILFIIWLWVCSGFKCMAY